MHLPSSLSQQFLASSLLSGDAVKAARQKLGLEDPVYVQFDEEWRAGNPLFDWYSRRSARTITRMQRRKERRSPSFHEYIVIQLDNGEFYRVDRRPDQSADLIACVRGKEAAASDTIEPTSSFEENLHCPEGSSVLLDIKFFVPVQLQLILHILHAIRSHPKARYYTLQFYNCYFLAQAITFCTTRSVRKRHEKDTKDIEFPFSDEYWAAITPDPDVTDPANENFPRLEEQSEVEAVSDLRGRLAKKAVKEGRRLVKRLNGDEDSDLSSIWELKQFDPKEHGPSSDIQISDLWDEELHNSAQLLSLAWSYGGRINQIKTFIKGAPHLA